MGTLDVADSYGDAKSEIGKTSVYSEPQETLDEVSTASDEFNRGRGDFYESYPKPYQEAAWEAPPGVTVYDDGSWEDTGKTAHYFWDDYSTYVDPYYDTGYGKLEDIYAGANEAIDLNSAGMNAGGLYTYVDENGQVHVIADPERQAYVQALSDVYSTAGGEYGQLREDVAVGGSNRREATAGMLRATYGRQKSDLRADASRRGILGSSVRWDAENRQALEYQLAYDDIMSEIWNWEVEKSGEMLAAQTQALAAAEQTWIEELNFEAGVGQEMIAQQNALAAEEAQLAADLAKAQGEQTAYLTASQAQGAASQRELLQKTASDETIQGMKGETERDVANVVSGTSAENTNATLAQEYYSTDIGAYTTLRGQEASIANAETAAAANVAGSQATADAGASAGFGELFGTVISAFA